MTDQFDNAEFIEEEETIELETDGFDDEFEVAGNFLEGDERTVTIRNTSGSEIVPWRDGMTLADAIEAGNLVLRAQADFYLDDASIEMDTVLPQGAVITAIGASQKGG